MKPTKVQGPRKAAFGSNVRLQTWFFLLALPTIAMLAVMLAGAVWGTRQRIGELEQRKRDGGSIAVLEGLIMALAVELRETAGSLDADGAGPGKAKETNAELVVARKTTDSVLASAMSSLALDRSEPGTEERASDPQALRTLVDSMRDAENAVVKLSREGKGQGGGRAFGRVAYINEDLLTAELMARFHTEQLELENALASLTTGNLFNRVTLGGARAHLAAL